MVEASPKVRLEAKGVKGPLKVYSKLQKPAIAHLVVKELQHYWNL